MITCSKCSGKVFLDFTYTDNKNYETFCLRCGKRTFVGPSHELYVDIKNYVEKSLMG